MDFFLTLYVFCSSSVVSSCVFNWNLCVEMCVTLHLDEFFVIFFFWFFIFCLFCPILMGLLLFYLIFCLFDIFNERETE